MKLRLLLAITLLLSINTFSIGKNNEALEVEPGLKLTALSKANSSDKGSPTTMYIGASQLVLEAKQGKNNVTITFDANQNIITLIDHQKKQYSILSEKELQEINAQIKQFVGLIKAFYNNMPAEQKEKLAPLINGKPNNIQYSNGPTGIKVNKWNTSQYKATYDQNKPLFDTNIVKFSEVGVNSGDMASVKKLAYLLDKYLSGIEQMIPGASVFSNLAGKENPMFEKGVPVKTVTYNSKGVSKEELIVTDAQKINFSLSDFKVPSGYKFIKLDVTKQLGGQ